MTNILRGVTIYGTAAIAGKLSSNIGGKTGTTNNYVDALFVGFSEKLVVGAWAGFDDNRSLGYGEAGGKTALPIWIDYMGFVIPRDGAPDFKVPEGITYVSINKETGKPLPPGAQGFTEAFVVGTEPGAENKIIIDQGAQTDGSIDDAGFWDNQ